MSICYGGGIRHTLSRRCVEDEHEGAREYYAEQDKHERTCGWVIYEREVRCTCGTTKEKP